MKPRNDTRNYGKFHPRFAAGGAVEDVDSDDDAPIQMAANLIPPKGSVEAVRPGKVPGESGGGGSPGGGGRLDFKSAGTQRRTGEAPPRPAPAAETPEAAAQRKAEMKAAYDKLMSGTDKPKAAPPPDPSAGRIGFKSIGTAKDDDE